MLAGLINLVLQLVVLGFIYWVITLLPFLVEPWRRILLTLVVLIGGVLLVMFLLGMVGIPYRGF